MATLEMSEMAVAKNSALGVGTKTTVKKGRDFSGAANKRSEIFSLAETKKTSSVNSPKKNTTTVNRNSSASRSRDDFTNRSNQNIERQKIGERPNYKETNVGGFKDFSPTEKFPRGDSIDENAEIADAVNETSFQKIFRQVVEAAQTVENQAKIPADAPAIDDIETAIADMEKLLADGFFSQFQPLTQPQQEVITKIALLVADGGVDAQMLAEIDQSELAQLADFLRRDESGLFAANEDLPTLLAEPNLTDLADVENADADAENLLASAPKFIADAAEALAQFAELRETLANAPKRESALIGDLVNLKELPALDVDRLAQAIIKILPSGENSENLRDLLRQTPPEDIALALADAAEKIISANGDSPLAELPDDVPPVLLKSLAIEIINVNNVETSAAEKQLVLLDGLERNAQLRAEIVKQAANSGELPATVDENALRENLAKTAWVEEMLADQNIVGDEGKIAPKVSVPTAEKIDDGTVIENVTDEIETSEFSAALLAETDSEEATDENDDAPISAENRELKAENPRERKIGDEIIEAPAVKKNKTPKNDDADSDDDLAKVETNLEDQESPFAELFADENDAAKNTAHFTLPKASGAVNAINEQTHQAESGSRQAILQENVNRLTALIDQSRSTGQALKSLTLALNPPELGKVTVELQLSANGGVSATVKTENDAARTLLLSGLDSLRKSLEARGVTLEQFNVELGGKDAGAQEQSRDQNSAHNGGDWFGAMSDERDRRARNQARGSLYNERSRGKSDDEISEKSGSIKIRAGSSFELIA